MGRQAVIEKVRTALGRSTPLKSAPTPPAIDEHIARLVFSDIGLPELFQKRARDMKMLVERVSIDDLLEKLAAFLREQGCKSAMLSDTAVLRKLNAVDYLKQHEIDARLWSEMTSDSTYDIDAGITEVDYAVAETGSLVIRHRPANGRLLSLVPFVHVAVLEPKVFVADLIDLFDKLSMEGTGSGVTLISGPSKTADIEMNTVTGVHGPNVVMAFVLA